MTARSKLLELINAGKIPANFSYLGDDHKVTTTETALTDWKADSDCSDVVPFSVSMKGLSNITQRPRNAAYSVLIGGTPPLGTTESRGNIIRRPVVTLPEGVDNKILHISAYNSPLINNEASVPSLKDVSSYSTTFLAYQSDTPVTMDEGTVHRVPNYVFSGKDSYIYADSTDNWDAGNESNDEDHLVSITGSTIYMSFVLYNTDTYPGSEPGAELTTDVADCGGFNINESLHYCINNVSTGPRMYSLTKDASSDGLGALQINDETVSSTNSSGDLLVISRQTSSLDFDVYLSELIIYDSNHHKDRIDDTLKYLYCRNHIGASDVSGSLAGDF